jgi:NTE family protein
MTAKPAPRLGLALGGGGARGLVHIGVLKVLEAEGIPVACVAGTSMGGIIAAGYATGISAAEMEQHALHLSKMRELVKLVDVARPRRGLLQGERVRSYLVDFIGKEKTFDDCLLPLALCAVDLQHACPVTIRQGNLLQAVLATIAVPGLFPPQILNGQQLVDGGVLNNVPADLARMLGGEIVLAVDPGIDPTQEPPFQEMLAKSHFPVGIPEFFVDLYRAGLMMSYTITQQRLKETQPDLVLNPPIPADITMFLGFTRAAEVIAIGEQAARQALPELRKLLLI